MALPKIEPLSSEFDVAENDSGAIKNEIERLGKSIQDSTTLGMKAATQAVVGNVPEMIKELTEDIQSGSIDNFATAINKLVKLVNELGINLRDYNQDLADTVDKFTNKQMKLEDKLSNFREMGLKAEIKNGEVRLLTQRDVFKAQKEKVANEKIIQRNIERREKLQADIDNKVWETSKARSAAQKKLVENEQEIQRLKLDNEEIDKKTNTTADTGRDVGGFSKLAELKEAFMVIPDTINEAFGQFANVGKKAFSGFMTFLGAPLKTIGKMFKSIANIFRTARAMIALKVLAVIAAFQFVVERIDMIGALFSKIWSKITGFFKGIVEWFKNSPVGKFFGLSGEDTRNEKQAAKSYDQMDEGTYEVGVDTNLGDDTVQVGDEFRRTSKDPITPLYDPVSNEILQPDDPRYENARKNVFQSQQDYSDDEQSMIENLKSVTGNNVTDEQDTSSVLTKLKEEANELSTTNVINVQNNSNVSSQSSNASNVSGFIDHEPDTSFKYVRRDNGDQYI